MTENTENATTSEHRGSDGVCRNPWSCEACPSKCDHYVKEMQWVESEEGKAMGARAHREFAERKAAVLRDVMAGDDKAVVAARYHLVL